MWTQGVESQASCSIVVTGESVSRRNDGAQSTPRHRTIGGWQNANPSSIEGEMASTPMLFICDEGASGFNNLELEWFCHGSVPRWERTYSRIRIRPVQVPVKRR